MPVKVFVFQNQMIFGDVVKKKFSEHLIPSVLFCEMFIRVSQLLTKLPFSGGGGGPKNKLFFEALFSHYNREQGETHLKWTQLC